jgi:DNA ligase-4
MLVWDPVSEQHLPFGTLKTFAAQDSEKSASEFRKKFNPRPCFKVFDMLYLNGRCLTSMSVSARKKNMRRAFKEVKGHFEYTIEFEGKNTKDIRMRMDEVMEKKGEGLVVKHPSAKYVLNGRGNDWFKVKPEYMVCLFFFILKTSCKVFDILGQPR